MPKTRRRSLETSFDNYKTVSLVSLKIQDKTARQRRFQDNPMNRPPLHEIPLASVTFSPGTLLVTMSTGQWDHLLAAAYQQGATLLELDDQERPVAAYRSCPCEICNPALN